MNIRDFADMINIEIQLTRYPGQNERWTAQFKNCEVKDCANSGILSSAYGDAKTPTQAIRAYCNRIQGKFIVVNAMDIQRRREFIAPNKLVYGGKHG